MRLLAPSTPAVEIVHKHDRFVLTLRVTPNPDLDVLAIHAVRSALSAPNSVTSAKLSGAAESVGDKEGKFFAQDARNNVLLSEAISIPSQREAIIRIGRLLADSKMPAPVAVGHRIVHGGPRLRRHCLIDDEVLRQLEAARAFAPLHIPSALSVIRFAREHFPAATLAACFDTAFHADLAEVARSSRSQGTAIGRDPALRVSWSIVRIDRAPTCRRSARSPDHRPSRQWCKRNRGQNR